LILTVFSLLIEPPQSRFGVFFVTAVEDCQTHISRLAAEENFSVSDRRVRLVLPQIRRNGSLVIKIRNFFFGKTVVRRGEQIKCPQRLADRNGFVAVTVIDSIIDVNGNVSRLFKISNRRTTATFLRRCLIINRISAARCRDFSDISRVYVLAFLIPRG